MYRPYITGPIPSLQTIADVSKCLNFTNVYVAEYGQNVAPAWVLRVRSEDECGFSTWCAGLPLSCAAGWGPQAGCGTLFAHPGGRGILLFAATQCVSTGPHFLKVTEEQAEEARLCENPYVVLI